MSCKGNHVTDKESAFNIAVNSFRPSRSGAGGPGMYLGFDPVSAYYKSENPNKDFESGCLDVQFQPGRVRANPAQPSRTVAPPNHDSTYFSPGTVGYNTGNGRGELGKVRAHFVSLHDPDV